MFIGNRQKQVLSPAGIASGRFPGGAWKVLAMAAVVMVAWTFFLPWDARSFGPGGPAEAKAAFVEKAPGFVLKDLNGKPFRLSDFKGKRPVLIIFGATWCGFCREEIPHFKAIHAAYAKQGLEIVNIDSQESKERVTKFASKYELPYRVLLDEDGTVAGIYEIPGVPVMVLVDKNGNIVCRMCQRVEPIIESLLKKK
jgi:peroxiredoxin